MTGPGFTNASLEALCADLCHLVGVGPPDLARDGDGMLSIEVEIDEVQVVLSDAGLPPDRVAFAVTFGPLPADRELDACRVLMDINARVLRSGSAFGLDPQTGTIQLSQVLAIGQGDAVAVHERIARLAGVARAWRGHHFLTGETRGGLDHALVA